MSQRVRGSATTQQSSCIPLTAPLPDASLGIGPFTWTFVLQDITVPAVPDTIRVTLWRSNDDNPDPDARNVQDIAASDLPAWTADDTVLETWNYYITLESFGTGTICTGTVTTESIQLPP
jgi:hypothetical protein